MEPFISQILTCCIRHLDFRGRNKKKEVGVPTAYNRRDQKCCLQAIVALVKAAYEAAREEGTDVSGQPETYALSHVYQGMITELVRVTDRPDGHQANLRLAAFETLMELIKDSPKDCYQHVQVCKTKQTKKNLKLPEKMIAF